MLGVQPWTRALAILLPRHTTVYPSVVWRPQFCPRYDICTGAPLLRRHTSLPHYKRDAYRRLVVDTTGVLRLFGVMILLRLRIDRIRLNRVN